MTDLQLQAQRTGAQLFATGQGHDLFTPWGDGENEVTGAEIFDPTPTGPRVFTIRDVEYSQKKFRPQMFLLFGRRDMGKTLAMTTCIKAMQEYYRVKGFGGRFRTATNYYCRVADIQHPRLVEAIVEFPEWAYELYCGVDELQNYVYRRRSMAGQNVSWNAFMTVIRKIRSEVITTTQFPGMIDVDTLMQVDGFIECQQLNEGRMVRLYVHDFFGQYIGYERSHKNWPPKRWDADKILHVYNTDTVWNDYDDEQVVRPRYSRNVTEDVDERAWAGREVKGDDLMDARHQWAKEVSPQMEEAMARIREQAHKPMREDPETLEELLASGGWPNKVDARGPLYDLAKRIDPTIKNIADMVRALERVGYTVDKVKGRIWGELKEAKE